MDDSGPPPTRALAGVDAVTVHVSLDVPCGQTLAYRFQWTSAEGQELVADIRFASLPCGQ